MADLLAVGRRIVIGQGHSRSELRGHAGMVTGHPVGNPPPDGYRVYEVELDAPLPGAYHGVRTDGWLFREDDVLPAPPAEGRWESYAHHTVLRLDAELARHDANHRRIRGAVESELRWANEMGVDATQLKLTVETLNHTTWYSDNVVGFVEADSTVVSVNGPRLRPADRVTEEGWVSQASLVQDHYAREGQALCGMRVTGAHSRTPLRDSPCKRCLDRGGKL